MQTRASRRRSRTRGGVAITAGAVLAVAGGIGLVTAPGHGAPHPAAGTPPVAGRSSTGTAAPVSPRSVTSRSATPAARSSADAGALPQPTSASTRVPIANPAGAACVPARLTVAGIGISGEQVVPMGTNAQGQIYPPAHTTMWYDRSAQPGRPGIAVIAGHVTYDGPDNFYNLRDARVGTRVTVVCANDRAVDLQVTGTASIAKRALTTDQRVWGASRTPVVVLVTCDIDSPMVAGHHLDNFVVWTRPVRAAQDRSGAAG